jgi:hypothetical protein
MKSTRLSYQSYTVIVCDIADQLSELGPESEAGVFWSESEAKSCLEKYLRDWPSIYKWRIEMRENGNTTFISQDERQVNPNTDWRMEAKRKI